MVDVINGNHFFEEHKTILIQIQDVCTWKFAEPLYKDRFVEIHQFEFMDNDDADDDCNITEEQAEKIAAILTSAKERQMNIVVHRNYSETLITVHPLYDFALPFAILYIALPSSL